MLYAPKQLRQRSIHSGRLERWLGADRIDTLASQFRNGGGPGVKWYGPPVNLADVPGSVWVTGDGDFVGSFDRGFVASAADSLADHLRRLWREAGRPFYINEPLLGVGFSGIPDLIERMRTGYSQYPNGNIQKVGGTGVANVAKDLWHLGNTPAIGVLPSSGAAAGLAHTDASVGGMPFNNPSSGTLHLIGADLSASVLNNSVMIYDRLWSYNLNGNKVATAQTGVPTRYQSTTAGSADSIEGNFMLMAVPVSRAFQATSYNNCQYTDQGGNTAQAFQTISSNAVTLQAGDMVLPSGTWFFPLASGDTGIKALTQTGFTVNTFPVIPAICHSLGVCMFPQLNGVIPFDWATRRELAPRVFDDACIALMELPKPSTATTTYAGQITLVNAP